MQRRPKIFGIRLSLLQKNTSLLLLLRHFYKQPCPPKESWALKINKNNIPNNLCPGWTCVEFCPLEQFWFTTVVLLIIINTIPFRSQKWPRLDDKFYGHLLQMTSHIWSPTDFPNVLTSPLTHKQHLTAHNSLSTHVACYLQAFTTTIPCGQTSFPFSLTHPVWFSPFLTAAEGLLWPSDLIPTPWPS